MAISMVNLVDLAPQNISKNLRGKYLMFYGQPKTGKTTLASKFEKVLIAGFEAGTNALDNVYVQPVKTWNDWKNCVKQLCTNKDLKEKFYTIAIDTADQAWQLVDKYMCHIEGVDDLGDVAYGKLYKKKLEEFMSTFRELSYEGYGLIFISHATEKIYKDENGVDYTRAVPSLPSSGANNPFDALNKFVDIIAYIQDNPTKRDGEEVDERYLCLRGTSQYLAGSRLAYVPDKIPLSYDELVKTVCDAVEKEAALAGKKATQEASPYLSKTFDEYQDEARDIWAQAVEKGTNEQVLNILEKHFKKPIRFSEIQPEDTEILAEALNEIKSIM